MTLGCQTYSQSEVISFMLHATNRDVTYRLGAQLAAAKLNISCNGTDPSCVQSAIEAADAWLCRHPIGSHVRADSAAWHEISATYNTLVEYNSGHLCAPAALRLNHLQSFAY